MTSTSERQMLPNHQGAAAHRRPALPSDGLGDLSATVAADRAFPAAVADLTSEVIRQGFFAFFVHAVLKGLLPSSICVRRHNAQIAIL
jgi:hypothetical protein